MTCQTRELMLHQGRRRPIRALPLERCGRAVPDFGCCSTGCYRGYLGTWEVRDDSLHLIELAGPNADLAELLGPGLAVAAHRDGMDRMFPGHGGSVVASWFSGSITPDDGPEDGPFFAL